MKFEKHDYVDYDVDWKEVTAVRTVFRENQVLNQIIRR